MVSQSRILLVTFSAAAAFAAAPPAPPAHWTDGYVLANDIRIHYWRTGGNKPPLVLAHGSSDDGLCRTNLAKELEADFDIVLPDARGHGLSDPPKLSDSPDVQADDLAGLIRELKLAKPIVMGHSMGATSVAGFAAKYPDTPRAVILEDPGLVPRVAGAPGPPGVPADPEKRRAAILARNNMTYAQIVADCQKKTPNWGLSECEFWAPSKRRHHPDTGLISLGTRPSMSALFPKITAPTLILKADAQGELRQQNEEITRLLKNGKIVHIQGAGHNVRRDQKQRTLAVLKEFFAGL